MITNAQLREMRTSKSTACLGKSHTDCPYREFHLAVFNPNVTSLLHIVWLVHPSFIFLSIADFKWVAPDSIMARDRPGPPEAWPCSQPVQPQSRRVETQPGLGLPSEVECFDSARRYRQRRFPHRSPVSVLYRLRIGLVPLGSRSRGCEAIPEIGAFSSFREFAPNHFFNDTRGERFR
jgi:hypothetical protein